MRKIIVIAHDIRSTHNVGALLRTAECMGVEHVFFTGYTPYPTKNNDSRLPHIANKLSKQIHKTALGTEDTIAWSQNDDITSVIRSIKNDGYMLVALEQDKNSIPLTNFNPPDKCALLIGREVEGIDRQLLAMCESIVEIPQFGKKESLNVVQAVAIALYHCAVR